MAYARKKKPRTHTTSPCFSSLYWKCIRWTLIDMDIIRLSHVHFTINHRLTGDKIFQKIKLSSIYLVQIYVKFKTSIIIVRFIFMKKGVSIRMWEHHFLSSLEKHKLSNIKNNIFFFKKWTKNIWKHDAMCVCAF
jgi:hypothetical protein